MVRYSVGFLESLGIGPGDFTAGARGEGATLSMTAVADGDVASVPGSADELVGCSEKSVAAMDPTAATDTHRTFLELVKARPEDFVVNEIDWQGKEVTLSPEYSIPDPAEDCSSDAEARQEREGKRARLREDGLAAEEQMAIDGIDPLSVLPGEAREALRAFAAHGTLDGGGAAPEENAELDLGHFPDPTQRVPLLRACAATYRGLQTNSTGGRVSVRKCPRHAALTQLVGVAQADRIAALFHSVNDDSEMGPIELPPDPSREHRTQVHRAISQHYGKLLDTKTLERGGAQQICVRLKNIRRKKRKRARGGSSGAPSAQETETLYALFVLQKQNIDHLGALELLSSTLGCPAHSFGVCGLKDKVGITTQLVSVPSDREVTRALKEAQMGLEDPRVVVGPAVRSVTCPLRRGQHLGNLFSLRLGGIPEPVVEMTVAALQRIDRLGFVNYFGVQRFGAEEGLSLSSTIGRCLLKREWGGALLALLGPDPKETDVDVAAARYCFVGRAVLTPSDVEAALDRMPPRRPREKALLRALRRHGVDDAGCEKAMMVISQPMRQFYVHAYASFLFNKMASARISANWAGPIAGDLVGCGDASEGVKVLSSEEAGSGTYSLADIVLPVPGYKSIFPPKGHCGGDVGRAQLIRDAVDKEDFRIPKLDVVAKGAYRKLLARPTSMSHRWTGPDRGGGTMDLHLTFELAKSSYATMLIHAMGGFPVPIP